MFHSQNFEVTVEGGDFTIFLAVSLREDFTSRNISRKEMLSAYVSKVYELYEIDKGINTIVNNISAT